MEYIIENLDNKHNIFIDKIIYNRDRINYLNTMLIQLNKIIANDLSGGKSKTKK